MHIRRIGFFTVALVVALLFAAWGRVDAGGEQKKKERGQFQFGQRGQASLLPADAADKLGLTGDVKDKFTAIVKDFETKNKEASEKLQEAVKKARENMDREALREILEQAKEVREKSAKLRDELQSKVQSLLNDEQKKKLVELVRAQGRFGGPGAFGVGPGGGVGKLLSPALESRLNLTAEQKDKLAKVQKEAEAKLNEILTEEQRKQLQELRTAPGGFQFRPKGVNPEQKGQPNRRKAAPILRAPN